MLFKTECIRPDVFHTGPYKTIADVEYAVAGWSIGTTTGARTPLSAWSHPPKNEQAHCAALDRELQPQ